MTGNTVDGFMHFDLSLNRKVALIVLCRPVPNNKNTIFAVTDIALRYT